VQSSGSSLCNVYILGPREHNDDKNGARYLEICASCQSHVSRSARTDSPDLSLSSETSVRILNKFHILQLCGLFHSEIETRTRLC
jgi:hypothetical protein